MNKKKKCCSPKTDLKPYNDLRSGWLDKDSPVSFCVKCGQIWIYAPEIHFYFSRDDKYEPKYIWKKLLVSGETIEE